MERVAGPDRQDARLCLAYIAVAFVALFLGALAGVLQALQRTGVIELPLFIGYYQLLTAHGVLLALGLTTYFIIGFLLAGVAKTLGGRLTATARRLGWVGFWVMTVGTVLATYAILMNKGTVLYTFYAPLKASPSFYIGTALLVVGSWISGAAIFLQYRHWKRTTGKKLSPLFAYMAVVTYLIWIIATLGVAAEVVLQLIPWSAGWVDRINVLLSRTLFWYFGHPLVYFWLLAAYAAWYVVIPKIIGGKVFSDALARLAFALFILLSVPVGIHHQLTEPGLDSRWKLVHVFLTMMVVVPSLMTAFSIAGSFEIAGRLKGAKGLFGWIKMLPWRDVRFFAPFVGMVMFVPGGAGGIINASYQLNTIVHNTLFIVGHFHLTLAATVVLTYFGVAYWLIPYLAGRTLTPTVNRLGMVQTLFWTVGMLLMSGGMKLTGLLGEPRRTAFTTYGDHPIVQSWEPYRAMMAMGGVFLFLGAVLMVALAFYLMLGAPKGQTEFPLADTVEDAHETPAVFERWSLWVGVLAVLILIAYSKPILDAIRHAPPGSPGFVLW